MSPALYGRASARAPSHSHFLAKLVSLDFLLLRFLELFLFFYFRIHDVCESRVFVVSRASNRRGLAMKSLMMLRFRLNIAPPFLRPSLFRTLRNKASSRLTQPFVVSFKLVSNNAGFRALLSDVILHLAAIIVVL